MRLSMVPLAQTVRVRDVHAKANCALRLMEMGLVEGAEVRVVAKAPLGDPLHLCVGDYRLSLRARDAQLVEIEP